MQVSNYITQFPDNLFREHQTLLVYRYHHMNDIINTTSSR